MYGGCKVFKEDGAPELKSQESAWRNLMAEGSEMKPCIGGTGTGSLFPLPAQSVEMSPRGKTQGALLLWRVFRTFSPAVRVGLTEAVKSTSKPLAVWSGSRAGVLVSLDRFWQSQSKNSAILLAQEKTLRFFTKVKAEIKTFSAWQGEEWPRKLWTGLSVRDAGGKFGKYLSSTVALPLLFRGQFSTKVRASPWETVWYFLNNVGKEPHPKYHLHSWFPSLKVMPLMPEWFTNSLNRCVYLYQAAHHKEF